MIRSQWNTGRLYTRHGQRMIAETDGCTVTFRDLDRQIEGTFESDCEILSEPLLRLEVDHRYLHNKYASTYNTRLEWQEG